MLERLRQRLFHGDARDDVLHAEDHGPEPHRLDVPHRREITDGDWPALRHTLAGLAAPPAAPSTPRAGRYDLMFARYGVRWPVTLAAARDDDEPNAMLVSGHVPL